MVPEQANEVEEKRQHIKRRSRRIQTAEQTSSRREERRTG
jgi:hypothetical protein